LIPVEDGCYRPVTKHDRRIEPVTVILGGQNAVEMFENLKTVPVSSPGEDVFFPIAFSDAYQMIMRELSFRATKIGIKCKHLLSSASVALRGLCYLLMSVRVTKRYS
jgi:hypothetical protein